MNWQSAISQCHQRAEAFAVATVISTTGSAPRESNAKMVVTPGASYDTIGGGGLEHQVIGTARTMLETPVPSQRLEHYPLATRAGQCCGGSVTVLLEAFPVTAMRLAIFGAGHVATCVVKILAQCDTRIDWIDSRPDLFPPESPANVKLVGDDDPVQQVSALSDQHRVLILTHDHALDYRLVVEILATTEISYLGLIGSETKAKRFTSRLLKDGFGEADRGRVRSPVGLSAVNGKLPMEIAVSIAAELLSLERTKASQIKPALSWREIRAALDQLP